MADILLKTEHLSKSFGGVKAVQDFKMCIRDRARPIPLRTCIHSRRILDRRGILYPINANFCRRAAARQENLTWRGAKDPPGRRFTAVDTGSYICLLYTSKEHSLPVFFFYTARLFFVCC